MIFRIKFNDPEIDSDYWEIYKFDISSTMTVEEENIWFEGEHLIDVLDIEAEYGILSISFDESDDEWMGYESFDIDKKDWSAISEMLYSKIDSRFIKGPMVVERKEKNDYC